MITFLQNNFQVYVQKENKKIIEEEKDNKMYLRVGSLFLKARSVFTKQRNGNEQ